MKEFLSGNEAVARGAYEAGVLFARAYPGTPSTEILESIAKYEEVDAAWSVNEKVALEAAAGAAYCGARSIACMKHVGLNVASDPFMTLAYTGIEAGLVIVGADDPGAHSSQNEQDNRHYARFAGVPLLEPSSPQEAYEFTKIAFQISEEFDTPVLLRLTTRVSHSKGVVELGQRQESSIRRGIRKKAEKYVMVPKYARVRHKILRERLKRLAEYAENTPLNRWEKGSEKLGIITSGVVYGYVREVFPEASVLKLGLSYPLPENLIRKFAESVEELWVIEELDRVLEMEVRALGIDVKSKPDEFMLGELTPDDVRAIVEGGERPIPPAGGRRPVMCPGCPHRGVFWVLSKLKLYVMGDIGCYTLGALPPLSALHTCLCMGAGVSGMSGARSVVPEEEKNKVVAVIGDSTFVHSGITGLVEAVYNKTGGTIIIMDNSTTAMTGGQAHPGTGITLKGGKTHKLDFKRLAEAIGVEEVFVVDPYNLEDVEEKIKKTLESEGVSLIIASRECVLLNRVKFGVCFVDEELCRRCGVCLKLDCPAIIKEEDGRIHIDELLCNGCGLCMQVCPFDAIKKEANDGGS